MRRLSEISDIVNKINSESNLFKIFIKGYNYDEIQIKTFLDFTQYDLIKTSDYKTFYGQTSAYFVLLENCEIKILDFIKFIKKGLMLDFEINHNSLKHFLYTITKITVEYDNLEIVIIYTGSKTLVFFRPLYFYISLHENIIIFYANLLEEFNEATNQCNSTALVLETEFAIFINLKYGRILYNYFFIENLDCLVEQSSIAKRELFIKYLII